MIRPVATAMVTGAGSGIGRATTHLFAERGWNVVGVDVSAAGLDQTLQSAPQPERIAVCTADVTDVGAVEEAVALAHDRFGGLDTLVAAAALGDVGRLDEMDPVLWDRVVDVTLKGSAVCCRATIPAIREAGGGTIVLFGSVLGRAMLPGVGAYAAAKAGIEGLARTLAIDFAAEGIRVNCVIPGSTDTPMMWIGTTDVEAARKMCEEDIPLGRVAAPSELARCVLFLASEESSFVTGTSLVADGGVLAKLSSRL